MPARADRQRFDTGRGFEPPLEPIGAKPSGAQIFTMARARKRKHGLYKYGLLALVLAAVSAGAAWKTQVGKRAPRIQFVTAEVTRGALRETVTATGTLKGLDTVDVSAQISGRVVTVLVDFNDPVKTGQPLLEMDQQQLTSKVEQSTAQVTAADAAIRLARATWVQSNKQALRAREMSSAGLLSKKDLEAAQADAVRAAASLASAVSQATLARATLKDAETSFGYSVIRSPIDGVVLSRQVEAGQTVAASLQAPVLFTLARDLTQLRLIVNVDEADIGRVKEVQSASFTVDAWPNRKFSSKVVSVRNLPTPGQTVVTYQAVLAVDNAERLLRPGMTATATIVTADKQDVLQVPDAALRFVPRAPDEGEAISSVLPSLAGARKEKSAGPNLTRKQLTTATPLDNQGVVYVLQGESAVRRVIDLGGADGTATEVVAGPLQLGERVILDQEQAKP